ncbi:putative RING-type E3 ubiquitin transferase C3H69 isoform X1 [Salvia splendens]|uniref:putative RING-type E3 ubiquitin transferase C3H69 isoform X1 n=1 Tax=Salvia splendens TaxID=180675 RepID=UPI001C25E39B|nr:putative RING-type E3 ubiquitin transferase C3H69 isoform X1 [Salvia splendens]XP_042066746.1 putative RING-type E3 ubiquitin transferase C3H69 isoform X1 [Salvia splendens]XP_042066747.1 putative RING-type E3 ubiquitin transferase C3H69 isoform X1 [Salvia splendens]XP_042066748.1 putative RING-type E3 ubiquitin transferase C3H69 isoform X1 [Salvia splendens]XP_042066749.1 putative RING-type E3 ubiquitin transferase C3H69 isoform X1 [Salvia splendens]XP_042066750.1 putative RING-type E3 ubi
MSKRVICKFFAHGACLKGEHCEFAHDWKAPSSNICTFYQKGICTYGSRCRYEHVKLSPSSSDSPLPVVSGTAVSATDLARNVSPPSGHHDMLNDDNLMGHSNDAGPSGYAMCSFAAVGDCPRGEDCPHIHGDVCPICEKRCLHPFRPQEREEHLRSCEKRRKHLEALRCSQDIECSVCLEAVLSKPTSAERKFGILSECDHSFCILCIRNWRSSSPSSGIHVNSAIRACPICRRLSYFVIPSVVWYSSSEEKQEIIQSYKTKLRFIDCKHFDFGNGTCPFGTSCFYKHAFQDGHLEEVVVRHVGGDDGDNSHCQRH